MARNKRRSQLLPEPTPLGPPLTLLRLDRSRWTLLAPRFLPLLLRLDHHGTAEPAIAAPSATVAHQDPVVAALLAQVAQLVTLVGNQAGGTAGGRDSRAITEPEPDDVPDGPWPPNFADHLARISSSNVSNSKQSKSSRQCKIMLSTENH